MGRTGGRQCGLGGRCRGLADARPTAPAAMLKPKVVNTSLLPVMIFMALICCLLLKKWAPMAFGTNKSFE
jgi:hypothetical protein